MICLFEKLKFTKCEKYPYQKRKSRKLLLKHINNPQCTNIIFFISQEVDSEKKHDVHHHYKDAPAEFKLNFFIYQKLLFPYLVHLFAQEEMASQLILHEIFIQLSFPPTFLFPLIITFAQFFLLLGKINSDKKIGINSFYIFVKQFRSAIN